MPKEDLTKSERQPSPKIEDALTIFSSSLPQELIKCIALYLDYRTLLCISEANDHLKKILEDNLLWKIKFLQYFHYTAHIEWEFEKFESEEISWRENILRYSVKMNSYFDGRLVAMMFTYLERDDVEEMQQILNNRSLPMLFDNLVYLQSTNKENYWRNLASSRMLSYFYDSTRHFFESEQINLYRQEYKQELDNQDSTRNLRHREYMQTQLYWALVLAAPLTEIKRLVERNPKCLEEQYQQLTDEHERLMPIHLAAREGNLEVVQFFLELDRTLIKIRSYKNGESKGPNLLYWAATKNHTNVVKYCLQQEDLECTHEALSAATLNQAKETLIILLDANVDIKNEDAINKDNWISPAFSSLELITLILEKRPHLIHAMVYSQPLLYLAASDHCSLKVFQYLLSRPGVDLNLGLNREYLAATPLHHALCQRSDLGHFKVQALIEAKADLLTVNLDANYHSEYPNKPVTHMLLHAGALESSWPTFLPDDTILLNETSLTLALHEHEQRGNQVLSLLEDYEGNSRLRPMNEVKTNNIPPLTQNRLTKPDSVKFATNLNLIPKNLQTSIISYLDPKMFVIMTRVSQNFKRLIDEHLPKNIHRFYGLYNRLTYAPYAAIKDGILLDNTLYLKLDETGFTYTLKGTTPDNPPIKGEILLSEEKLESSDGFVIHARYQRFLDSEQFSNKEVWAMLLKRFFDYPIMSILLKRGHIALEKSMLPDYNPRTLNHALYFLAQQSTVDHDFYRILCEITIPSKNDREDVYQIGQRYFLENRPMTSEAACPDLLPCIKNLPQICNTYFKAHALMQQRDLHALLPAKELRLPTKLQVLQRALVLNSMRVKESIYNALAVGIATGFLSGILLLVLGCPMVLAGTAALGGALGVLLVAIVFDLVSFIKYIRRDYESFCSTVKSCNGQVILDTFLNSFLYKIHLY